METGCFLFYKFVYFSLHLLWESETFKSYTFFIRVIRRYRKIWDINKCGNNTLLYFTRAISKIVIIRVKRFINYFRPMNTHIEHTHSYRFRNTMNLFFLSIDGVENKLLNIVNYKFDPVKRIGLLRCILRLTS